jgi:hypothetical protein
MVRSHTSCNVQKYVDDLVTVTEEKIANPIPCWAEWDLGGASGTAWARRKGGVQLIGW